MQGECEPLNASRFAMLDNKTSLFVFSVNVLYSLLSPTYGRSGRVFDNIKWVGEPSRVLPSFHKSLQADGYCRLRKEWPSWQGSRLPEQVGVLCTLPGQAPEHLAE